MGNFNLSSFRNKITRFARNQYFLIEIPDLITDNQLLTAMARTTEIPAMTHSTIEIPIRGVNCKYLGTPQYNDWSVSFLCDEDHTMRMVFLLWQSKAYQTNALAFTDIKYKLDGVKVSQIGSDGKTTMNKVHFFGMFPTNVGAVAFDQSGGNYCTFDVTFAYDYYITAAKNVEFGGKEGTGNEGTGIEAGITENVLTQTKR